MKVASALKGLKDIHVHSHSLRCIRIILIIANKALKNKLFVSCNGLERNKVGRSLKKKILHYYFGQKCVFYACFTLVGSWMGDKNFRVGIFLNKNLLG